MAPSNRKGMVTMPTVRMSISLATLAITGAAPVPVPPPIPAVIKAILVGCSNMTLISSMLSRAACSPTLGLAPAPRPSVRDTPNWILLGTELFCRAWESVLQITKSTPLIPALNMWLMALLPPPPTPITFMTLLLFLGRSKAIFSNSMFLLITVLFQKFLFGIVQEILQFLGPFVQYGYPGGLGYSGSGSGFFDPLFHQYLFLGFTHRFHGAVLGLGLQGIHQKTDRGRVKGAGDLLIGIPCQVLVGITDPGIHPGDVLHQLFEVLQLGTPPGKHDPGDQFLLLVLMTIVLDLHIDLLDDLHHPGMDNFGKVLQGDLLGLPAPEPRNGYDLIVLVLPGPGGTEFYLQQFGLFFDDRAALLDVLGNHIAPKGYHGGMSDDPVLEDGQIGGSAPDVDQGHPGFLLLLAQDRIGRGKGFQGDGIQLQVGTLDAAANVLDRGHLSDHHMEIGLQTATVHPLGLLDLCLSVHLVFLWQDMDDLLPGEHDQFVHLIAELVQVRIVDDLL